MHCHSIYSDGCLTPAALIQRAKACGVKRLALTDHDTLSGQREFFEAAQIEDLTAVSGIECSTQWCHHNVHVLALGFSLDSAVMQALANRLSALRMAHARLIAQRLEQATGLSFLLQQAQALAGKGQLGRPHFAAALVALGHVNSVSSAFKKYLGAGKLGDVKLLWPPISEVVFEICRADAVPVLAHPAIYRLTRTKLKRLIADFQQAGGLAVELSTPVQQDDFARWMARELNERQLAASVGSDFHQPVSWLDLGYTQPLETYGCTPVWQYLNCRA